MVVYARKRNRKILWGVVFAILVVGVVIALAIVRPWEKKPADDGLAGNTEATTSKSDETEKTEVSKPDAEVTEEKAEEVVQYEGENPNEAASLSGAVTYAGIVGEELVIRVNIDQYLASGSCKLELTRWDEVQYSETVGIVDAAATSTCEGFNIPISKLAGANYGIRILVESGGKSGTITGEVSQ